jgi:hypothetical protein
LEIITQLAQEYGLFVALVVYNLWANQKREERYIEIINVLSDEIKLDLAAIKNKLGDDNK